MLTRKQILISAVSLIILGLAYTQGTFNGNMICGKTPPKDLNDCSMADLDSGFRCCRVTDIDSQADTCVLLSYYQIKNSTLLKETSPKYDCGDVSTISANFVTISIVSLFFGVLAILI